MFVALDENVERRTRFARPVGSGRALRGRTSSSWRVRSPSSYRRFRVITRHITLRRGDDTAGPHANAHQRGARRYQDPPREPRLGSGSRGCARGRVRSRESGPAGDARSNARARENRAREDSGTPVARWRCRGAFGVTRGEGRVEAFELGGREEVGTGDAAPSVQRLPRRICLRLSATVHHDSRGVKTRKPYDYQELGPWMERSQHVPGGHQPVRLRARAPLPPMKTRCAVQRNDCCGGRPPRPPSVARADAPPSPPRPTGTTATGRRSRPRGHEDGHSDPEPRPEVLPQGAYPPPRARTGGSRLGRRGDNR